MTEAHPPIGVIGGSGLYSLLDDAEERTIRTPYGTPSDRLVCADLDGRRVIFLPRHGRDHRYPPHRVPYQANLWALHSLGVRQILAPCAVGGLDRALSPGDLVVPDQLIDRTTRRPTTYFDDMAVHVPFADPYCPRGRSAVLAAADAAGWPARDGGTMVVVEGPRFSSRAESTAFAAAGGTVVNMTGMPEAVLARELALCYTPIALVTDRDAGTTESGPVVMSEVLRIFAESTQRLRSLVLQVAVQLSANRDCRCPEALDGTPAVDTNAPGYN